MYWLHVDHPNSKARIHIPGGCHWVRQAEARLEAGIPYGPKLGNRNGYWKPFPNLAATEKAQKATHYSIQDRCRICFPE